MKTIMKIIAAGVAVIALSLGIYAYDGWRDAAKDAPKLKAEALALTQAGKGTNSLSARQLQILLAAEDPGFDDHKGLDLSTPGGGITTLTQALAKRVAFDTFNPGIEKLRQTTYAMSLERHLTKDEILTLSLSKLDFGRAQGRWQVGIYNASEAFFQKPVAALSDEEFAELTARLIAPGLFSKDSAQARLKDRKNRILALADGTCSPNGNRDVWLEGCADP